VRRIRESRALLDPVTNRRPALVEAMAQQGIDATPALRTIASLLAGLRD